MKSGERIERCIYYRPTSNRYAVHIRLNMAYQSRTFDTLEEARVFRALIESKRRKHKRITRDQVGKYELVAADRIEEGENSRAKIQKARKQAETVIRDGRKWKLVRL